jgi:Asp-tRNA(Asn)/Glu-tRNA(Gln) amidotransferase A subunit family amidase
MKREYAAGIGATSVEIKIITKQLDQLSTGQARVEERYEALLRSLTEMNSSINTLTYLQFDAEAKREKKLR